jgi:hypothetical protein
MPSACDSNGVFGCATENIPWVLGMLTVLVLLLIAARVALYLLELRRQPPSVPTTPGRPPRVVGPGSPLQPTPPQPVKPTPLQLRVADAPNLNVTDFASSATRGDFGEMITDIVLTGDGWKKLESKASSGVGIGGLYVREVKGGGGFEALAVDTKTNEAAYVPASMSDAALESALSALYAQGGFGRSINESVANELIRGLRNGPPFFRKELWRHNLTNGVTGVTQLGPAGEPKASTMRSHARLIAGAYASLKQLDRGAVYLGGRSIDDGAG